MHFFPKSTLETSLNQNPSKTLLFLSSLSAKFLQYYEPFSYLFFGIMTTAVNYGVYYAATRCFGLSIVSATGASWIAAVLFAFVTNKTLVFRSKNSSITVILRELLSFIGCRVFSGLLEMAAMWLFAEYLQLPDIPVKIAIGIGVIVLNYFFSKFYIFKKR